MIRKAFVMSVNACGEREYERRRSPICPELERTLNQHGVHNYSTFFNPMIRHLFGFSEFKDEQRPMRHRQTICRKWWERMKEIMPSHSDNSPISRQLREVFHID